GRIRPGDVLMGLEREDGTRLDFAGWTIADVAARIRGPEGTRIRLIVRPAGTDRTTTYELTRGVLTPPPTGLLRVAASGQARPLPTLTPARPATDVSVPQVALHPDGSRLAVLVTAHPMRAATFHGREERVQIRDGNDGRLIGEWSLPLIDLQALAYSPDGRTLAAIGSSLSVSAAATERTTSAFELKRQLLLLDSADGRILRTMAIAASA